KVNHGAPSCSIHPFTHPPRTCVEHHRHPAAHCSLVRVPRFLRAFRQISISLLSPAKTPGSLDLNLWAFRSLTASGSVRFHIDTGGACCLRGNSYALGQGGRGYPPPHSRYLLPAGRDIVL